MSPSLCSPLRSALRGRWPLPLLLCALLPLIVSALTACEEEERVAASSGPPCSLGIDCPPSSLCRRGECVPFECDSPPCWCDELISCGLEETCHPEERVCVPTECERAADCARGFLCRDQICLINAQLDSDQDGVVDGYDNCPDQINPRQRDLDEDGLGDLCDPTCYERALPCEEQLGATLQGQLRITEPCSFEQGYFNGLVVVEGLGRWGAILGLDGYSLSGIPPGRWRLLFYPHLDVADAPLKRSPINAPPATTRSVEIGVDDTMGDPFSVDAEVPPRGALAGRVLFAELDPLRRDEDNWGGVLVRLAPDDPLAAASPMTLSDPRGAFRLAPLHRFLEGSSPEASRVLLFTAPGYEPLRFEIPLDAWRQRLVVNREGLPPILRRLPEGPPPTQVLEGVLEREGTDGPPPRLSFRRIGDSAVPSPERARSGEIPLEQLPEIGERFGPPSRRFRFSLELAAGEVVDLLAEGEGALPAWLRGLSLESAPEQLLLLLPDAARIERLELRGTLAGAEPRSLGPCAEGLPAPPPGAPISCADSDEDGVSDAFDEDDDGDGLSDLEEQRLGWDDRMGEVDGPTLRLSEAAREGGYTSRRLTRYPAADPISEAPQEEPQGELLAEHPLSAALAPPLYLQVPENSLAGALTVSYQSPPIDDGQAREGLWLRWRDARCSVSPEEVDPGDEEEDTLPAPPPCPEGGARLYGLPQGAGSWRFRGQSGVDFPEPPPGSERLYWLSLTPAERGCERAGALKLCAEGLEEPARERAPECLSGERPVDLYALIAHSLRSSCLAALEEPLRAQLSCAPREGGAEAPRCTPRQLLSSEGTRLSISALRLRWRAPECAIELPPLSPAPDEPWSPALLWSPPMIERGSPCDQGLMLDFRVTDGRQESPTLRLPLSLQMAQSCW